MSYHDDVDHMIEVLSAWRAGKVIQIQVGKNEYVDLAHTVHLETLAKTPHDYRIKPEPVTRPWSNAAEMPPFPIQVRWKESSRNHRSFIAAANDDVLWLGGASTGIPLDEAFRDLEMLDGSPCGITEESK